MKTETKEAKKPGGSLFAKAKQTAPPVTGKATKEKVIVPVQLGDKLKRLTTVRETIETLEAEAEILTGDIKPVAREQFLIMMKDKKLRPESFILQSGGANMLVIVQDKYLKITETKEQMLGEHNLGELINEETTFSFNSDLLQKYEKQISDAISKIKGIPDDDKAKLIEATVSKTIKKGTIDRLPTMENQELVFNLIEPVIQLKNSK